MYPDISENEKKFSPFSEKLRVHTERKKTPPQNMERQ